MTADIAPRTFNALAAGVGAGGYGLAVGLAWFFSGSVLAPLTACPVAIVAGLLMAYLFCRGLA